MILPVILSEAERSRRTPWRHLRVSRRGSSTSLGMTEGTAMPLPPFVIPNGVRDLTYAEESCKVDCVCYDLAGGPSPSARLGMTEERRVQLGIS